MLAVLDQVHNRSQGAEDSFDPPPLQVEAGEGAGLHAGEREKGVEQNLEDRKPGPEDPTHPQQIQGVLQVRPTGEGSDQPRDLPPEALVPELQILRRMRRGGL